MFLKLLLCNASKVLVIISMAIMQRFQTEYKCTGEIIVWELGSPSKTIEEWFAGIIRQLFPPEKMFRR